MMCKIINSKKILFFTFVIITFSVNSFSSPIPKAPNPNVSSYVLMDYDSGMIIASKEPSLILPPASITKIMTSYIAFTEIENKTLSINEDVLVSKKAWQTGGSKMFIEVGKKVKVSDLLHGIITSSGNDASVAIAEHISGDEETFAIYMNQIAQNLGMNDTNYANSTGLPDDDLYTSAKDIALLSRSLIKDFPKKYKLYSKKEYVYNEIKQYSRNKLLYIDDTVDGIKTGFTKKAGYCLVTSAQRGKRRLISVVMGAKSPEARTNASKSLLEYGFRFYETHKIFKATDIITTARVFNGDKQEVGLVVKEDSYIAIPRRQIKNIKKTFVIDQNLSAPISDDEAVGYVAIKLNDNTLTTIKLYSAETVSEGNLYRRTIDSIIKKF
ncbi:MAG: serine-type D-Ala-D-Ala carboxypeptidase [Gammaproteobacteria bacterium]|nr:serine-type D-Ala-D-Ala carboxypeptidase [Gammaproteobacteria bacterium]|tara:strand:+ start:6389 stop:7537 length:1149 start_codon:yes stop_codon:yes gene_type:complete